MNAFKRGKKGLKSIYVPTRTGKLVQRATGTLDTTVVRGMKRMVEDLAERERWAILDAIEQKRDWIPPGDKRARRFTLSHAYQYYASDREQQLEQLLDAKNLAEHLTGWIAWVRANRQKEVRTADVYWQQVTTLVAPGSNFPAATLTKERVKTWLASRTEASSGTRRKYFYALKSFVTFLVEATVYEADPLAGMKAPKKDPARERFETEANDQRIVDAAIAQYRGLFATVKGTGCDLGSAIARAQKGDFDLTARTLNVRGTKTDRRRVHKAEIEAWAIPYIAEQLKTIVGVHTLVFAGLTNSGASHHHVRCCEAVGVEDYWLKDSRHSVAIRMLDRGRSYKDIARQLGTSVYQVVTVYTKYENAERELADLAKAAR